MGIYDRDYYREGRPTFSLPTPTTMVGMLVLINAVVYVVDVLIMPSVTGGYWLSDALALRADTLTHPWTWWRLVGYGFAHSPIDVWHILGNMLGLWFLGRDIEYAYGRKEFLRLYLVLLAFAGLVWCAVEMIQRAPAGTVAMGASGAVAGIVVLYALNFPRRTLLLFFVLPVPAWVVGVLLVLFDMYGATHSGGEKIAHSAHLAGAAFAFIYYQQRWNFGRLLEGRFRWPRLPFKRRPRLRVHQPENQDDQFRQSGQLSREVDRILEKISRQGEKSLSRKERRVLEEASREYQRRRRE
jgi:membrane associated rhomboid family serine protease